MRNVLVFSLLLIASAAAADPLIRVRVSGRAVEKAVTQSRRFQEPVRDEILGAQVAGASQNNLTISPRLVPSENSIRIALELIGDVRASTASRKSAATVRSVSNTNIRGQKLIDFNLERTVVQPATMSAATDSQIVDFAWGRVLGKSIARRRAAESKSASEFVSARKAAARAAAKFDQQVNPQIRNATREMRGQLLALPKRLGLNAYPAMHTRADHFELLLESLSPLRRVTPARSIRQETRRATPQRDVILEISETLFEEWAASRLSGRTFNSDQLSDLHSAMRSQVAAMSTPNSSTAKQQPWSVTFANPPLECSADGGTLKFRVGFQSMTRDDDVLPPMTVEATYRLEHQRSSRGDRWVLRREERLNVELAETAAGKAKRGVRAQVFRSTARGRLSPLIPTEISLNQLVPHDARQLASRIRFHDGAVSIRGGRVIISANQ